jgi:hypothetical protein
MTPIECAVTITQTPDYVKGDWIAAGPLKQLYSNWRFMRA